MQKSTPLLYLAQELVERDAAAAARRLEGMSTDDALAVMQALPARSKSRVFPLLQIGYAASLIRESEPADFETIIRGLDAERAASIFMQLPDDARERFAPHLPEKVRRHVGELLKYPQDSVGRLMTPHFFSMHKDMRVRDAIKKVRSMANRNASSYAYVVGENDALVGVLNMHDLLLAKPEETLESIMRRDVFVLPAFTQIEDAAKDLAKRRYFAAPVVDTDFRILGVVKAESLLRGAQDELGEDLQRMVGAGADESAFSSIGYSLRKRLPWLHVNLATAFLAASVVALFEGTIARFTVLAVFLPVVAGQGGNAGAQSLAIVMRGLVMREIPRSRWKRLILKEAFLGAVSGAATGAVTAMIAWVWYGNAALGAIVALGMLVNLVCAGLAGASIPIALKSLGLDPAQCSSIILTTVTDVVGFFAFLGLAFIFQGYLT
jgi:magnesium transporter